MSADALLLARAFEMVREATKDKSYLELPMGREVGRYLRAKRKELTDSSYRGYETCLHKLAIQFAYLELKDLELPVGAERIEEWMDDRWHEASPGTYNVNHSILSDFFKWQLRRGRMRSNPMDLVGRAKKRDVYRTVFSKGQQQAILAHAEDLRDRLALRLLLDYGIRKGALQKIQFRHFSHQRKRLTIFTKGQKIRGFPIPQPAFWLDLERHILDVEAQPDHYLMCVVKAIPVGKPDRSGHRRMERRRFPDRPMSSTALHRFWYRRLECAGIVAPGSTRGERMHKARHTAGQRVLDKTGDLKLVQKLLGHSSIQTTADVYVDYEIDAWAQKMADMFEAEE